MYARHRLRPKLNHWIDFCVQKANYCWAISAVPGSQRAEKLMKIVLIWITDDLRYQILNVRWLLQFSPWDAYEWMIHYCFADDRTITLPNLGWLGAALFGHCASPCCESAVLFVSKSQMTSSESPSDILVPFGTNEGCFCLLVSWFLLCLLLWFQLGTLHILDAMREAGHDIRTLFLCGGLSKNALFVQIHANATGI